ncbi:hypothetical protein [Desulfolutivibrio sp.]|uniref:hypothetical protein n=1 Tax=Desulfolutivibrio sp. TaxID=2773296 RepID=UPI002F96B099
MQNRNILISVKDNFANKIRLGTKRVELRRIFPCGKEGSRVYIYVPAPTKEIIGYFQIEKIYKMPIIHLWDIAGELSTLDKDSFFSYFSGRQLGYSIHFKEFIPLPFSLSLNFIKKILPKFHPPQSFIYLRNDIDALLHNHNTNTKFINHP